MAKTEVAKTETKIQLPAGYDMAELMADAQQNPVMDTQDVALPFIAILQSNSPEVNPGDPSYIEGAQSSMFINTVTRDIYEGRKEGLLIVPCHYERKQVEWVDRDKGGGWVGDYPADHPIARTLIKRDDGKMILPNGNFLFETAYQYILFMDPETSTWSQAVMGMKSTALKKNRQLNNSIVTSKIPGTEIQAPRFMFPYVMRTEFEQKGSNSWWNFSFRRIDDPIVPDLYKQAKQFATMIKDGILQRSTSAEQAGGDVALDEQGRPFNRNTGEMIDDEIPL